MLSILTLFAMTDTALAERWYKVEVLAFANPDWFLNQTLAGNPARVPEVYDATELAPAPATGPGAPTALQAFQELPQAGRNLVAAANRLDRAFAHRPLFYSAWVQPNYGGARARKVRLREPGEATPAINAGDVSSDALSNTEGFVRLRVGRTLNVDLDLFHQEGPASVRLSESRRVLFNEVHYFDHPGLGVLVRVSPVEFGDEG